jgi:tetratricopeptide (TPR) repeat protein
LIADAYVQLKDYASAETALKKYETISPEGKEKASEILSKIYMDQKRYQEATVELKNVVESNPEKFRGQRESGRGLFSAERL